MSRFTTLEGLEDIAPARAHAALRDAAAQLSDRGLTSAARWALELVCCIPKRRERMPAASTPMAKEVAGGVFPTHSTPALGISSPSWSGDSRAGSSSAHAAAPWGSRWLHTGDGDSHAAAASQDPLSPAVGAESPRARVRFSARTPNRRSSSSVAAASAEQEEAEADVYALAKASFDQRQYDRCAWLLEQYGGTLSSRARFLQLYARFLIFARQLHEHDEQLPPLPYTVGPQPGGGGAAPLVRLMEHLIDPADPFLLFLKGVLLRRLHKRVEAMDCLLSSVRQFPYNWSAWQELSRTLSGESAEREQIADLLPRSFMSVFFQEHAVRQAAQGDAANLERVDALLEHFPDSAYLMTCRAQTLYLSQELEEAAETFQRALALDPYRLDGLSEYSNTLYVLDHAEALAQLVQQFAHVGRDRPEVCCLVGNYYNQRGDHFRAVESFRRALRLDRGCVAAWILLGHEYLELKNSHAAAEMYRRALEINPQDYRPWHGLGQVYELNEAWSYAIHYYQKCAAIRPYDARMWASLGVCYDRLGRTAEAIASFKRHLTCPLSRMESVDALSRIIDLYERLGDTVHSTHFHRLLVHTVDRSMAHVDPVLVARFAFSYIIAARFEMGELQGKLAYSKAEQRAGQLAPPASGGEAIGDLALAGDYLQKVVLAGTDMAYVAEELLKKLAHLRAAAA